MPADDITSDDITSDDITSDDTVHHEISPYDDGALDPFIEDELPSRGLLSFYDRLRARIVGFAERRGDKLGRRASEALLLVPDVFMLLVRLALDADVPQSTRLLLGGAIVYFVTPIDLLPEGFIGPIGYIDDLVLAVAVLSQAFGRELEDYSRKYWSGRQKIRVVFRDVLEASEALLGYNVYDRLKRVLAKRGVDLDAATASTTTAFPDGAGRPSAA